MRLESAVHFCEQVSSGKLYNSQLVIQDGKLIKKVDAKIGTVDDGMGKQLKPVMLQPEMPKVVLSSAQVPQPKLVRPPTLVSVATQVYPLLLDNTSTELVKDGKSEAASLAPQDGRKCDGRKSKFCRLVTKNGTGSGVGKARFHIGINEIRRRSRQSTQGKCVKMAESAERCPKSRSCSASRVIHGIATRSKIPKTGTSSNNNMANTNNVVADTSVPGSNSKAEGNKESTDPGFGADGLDSGGKFRCSMCQFSTNNVRKISEHNRDHQRANNICYYCDRRFGLSTELSLHIDTDHADIKTSSTPFVCCSCPARFRTRTQLVAHLPKHSSSRPFICAKCGASFKWRNTLYDHAATHTSHKEHLCDICGYATAHRGQLRSHRLVHTGGTMRCSWPDCDFRATRMQNLKYHLLTHTQEKPHQCEVCGQSFSLAKNLKRHMMSHGHSARKHK